MPSRSIWGSASVNRISLAAASITLMVACSTDKPLGNSPGGFAFSVLPTGTVETRLAAGLASPTTMALAPDGRVFVSEQCGRLRVVKNAALLAAPALTLSVDCTGERGLLGVTVDPDFGNNHRIYLYYTVPGAHNRISRFTLNGDVVTAGSEQILFELSNLGSANYHNGGAVHIGPDGMLYAAVGDNGNSANSQSLNSLFGKVLRLNLDGSIPSNNPFFGNTSGANRAIWALGFRNPYTFAFQPGTGRMFINDVGEQTTEEVDDGIAGSNYGWPTCEGACGQPGLKDPLYSYTHTNGCAITGGAFYNPASTRFPSSYLGKYMFADYCGGYINVLDPATRSASNFSSGLSAPVDLGVSSDGGLFYLVRGEGSNTGEVWRVDGTTNQGPVITSQPAPVTVSVGQPASFQVAATGTAPITYQWQRNGVAIPNATAAQYTLGTTAMSDSGATFRCVVANNFGAVTSSGALLSVTSNQPPTATITSPTAGTAYRGGQTFNYAATASDPETGPLPASAFTWEVVFHHDTHTHPFIAPTSGATGGSFTIPTVGETSANVYYAILLTVTDPAGLSQTFERDIQPQKSTLSLQANPAGASITLDGQPLATPASVVGVVGIQRTLGVVSPQTIGGLQYNFSSWSDGGAASHTISTPASNTSYTATYSTTAPPGGAVAFVQVNANTAVNGSSLTVPLPGTTGTGNLLLVGVNWASASFGTISDAQGNSFTQVGTQQTTPGGVRSRFYYARNIRGGADAITVSLTGSDPSLQVYVAEYRGADPSNPLDVTAQRTGGAGSVTSGSVNTTAANDQVIGFCVSDGTCTWGSGFTPRSTHSNNLLEDRTQATAGSVAATATSNNGWSMVLAAFRPQQASSPPPPTNVTASVTAANKVFDGTTTATITGCSLSGSPAGVTCSAAAANFSDASVGNGKTVTATGITLAGPNAANYRLTSTTATTTANITPAPSGAVAFVQVNAKTGVNASSVTLPLPGTTTAGNLLVVGVNWASASFGTISDAQGNSFTQVGAQQTTPGGVKSRFYYARNIRGGSNSINVSLTGSDPSLQVYVAEYRGADATNPLDVTTQRTGSAGSVTSGSVTTTWANDQVIGFCVSDGTCTLGSGFTARSTHSNNLLEDRTQATVGSVAATATSNNGWSMVLAAFRPQQGSPPASPPAPTPVTASVTAANKVFDGTTTATITSCTLSGSPAGVTCSAAAASFSDAAVGSNKTVTATGITLSGANAGNYVLTSTTAVTTASITAAAGSVSFIAANAGTTVTGATNSVGLSGTTAAGDLIVVGIDWAGSASFAGISDNQGNGYTLVGSQVSSPGGMKTRLYYARNIKGGPASVTVTLGGTSTSLQVYVAQYRGAHLTNPLDVTAQQTGPAGSVTSGTVTTTSANDRVIGFCVSDGTCTFGSGFTARSTHSNNLLEDKVQSSPATVAATATSNNGWAMILAAIRPQ